MPDRGGHLRNLIFFCYDQVFHTALLCNVKYTIYSQVATMKVLLIIS